MSEAAKLLREARLRAGLSQRALAARAGTGQSVISRIESGHSDPSVGSLDRLLRAAGHRLHAEAVAEASLPAALDVVGKEFAHLGGAQEVYVIGSWAARLHGEPGPPPRDLDVLIVGDPARGAVHRAATRAADRIDVDVRPVVVSSDEWREARSGFLRHVRSRPLVLVAGVGAKRGGGA